MSLFSFLCFLFSALVAGLSRRGAQVKSTP
jgi:hypothetical protein